MTVFDYGTGTKASQELMKIVKENFDLRPGRIVKDLKLKFVTTLAMLGMAVIREGITGLLAVPHSISAGKDQKESEAEPRGKRAFN